MARGQAQVLRNKGCDELQGWLFSQAVPAEEVPALLQRLGVLQQRGGWRG